MEQICVSCRYHLLAIVKVYLEFAVDHFGAEAVAYGRIAQHPVVGGVKRQPAQACLLPRERAVGPY
jgi:hypothetical protein